MGSSDKVGGRGRLCVSARKVGLHSLVVRFSGRPASRLTYSRLIVTHIVPGNRHSEGFMRVRILAGSVSLGLLIAAAAGAGPETPGAAPETAHGPEAAHAPPPCGHGGQAATAPSQAP